VFCNSRRNTDFVAKNLRHAGIEAIAIHGGFSQNRRNDVMDKFHSQKVHVLVCTDVAGRGLDIKNVSHVYNYDIPQDNKQYIHRIGRTARAGSEGKAINLLSPRDHDNFSSILRYNDVKVTCEKTPYIKRIQVKTETSGRFQGRPRHRQSIRTPRRTRR
jgi:ATP-dependent RNA helicase DeaD